MTNFKRAKEITIFTKDSNESFSDAIVKALKSSNITLELGDIDLIIKAVESKLESWKGMKGIVNEVEDTDRFSIVGNGYKIAQHDDVIEIITKALTDLGVNHTMINDEMNDGARLRVNLRFPQIVHSIAGEQIYLWATFDNSYDQSTGLRLEINSIMPASDTTVYSSEIISSRLNKYYQRHTKGLEIQGLEDSIQKGIDLFQNEIVKEFQLLADTPVSGLEAKAWAKDMVENTSCKVAKKYLVMIQDGLSGCGVSGRITSAWNLYSFISSILTHEIKGVDLRQKNARILLNIIKKHHWGVACNVTEVESDAEQMNLELVS